ncbi:MAG: hypothetical protein IJ480_08100, partial [Clostridia bacterium]|nr:hypothetical protein [Clostridia bacterium]
VYDRSADRWRVENVMYNPDPAGGASITPGYSDFDSGNMFYSDASGEVKEYFAVLGMPRTASFFLMVKEQDLWKPVSAVCTVADLQHLLGGQYNARIVRDSYGEWADNDPADVLFWNDYNNDGYVTKDECVIIPSPCCTFTGAEPYISLEEVMPFYACCCSSLTPADLSFLGTLREQGHEPMACLVKPVRFRDGGKPVYLPEGICPITDQFALWGSAAQLPAKNLVIAFIRQNDQVWVAGFRRDTGEILWKHKSPYHQVHGSHNAPMPKPGMLIGCLKIAGIAEGCGDSDVFMVRGNLGEDYFLTTDGMYINTLTRDSRLPGVAFPEDAESLRKVSFSRFTGRCEHFSGVFVRQTDGIIRCSGGLPASQAGNIIRVEGLDTIRHIGQSQIRITADRIREAMQANQERMLAARTPLEPIRIVPAGEGWDLAPAAEIKRDGQQIHGTFRAMYSKEGLYLQYTVTGIRWVNGGNNWRLLFKTGDCLDFQCSPGSNQAKDPQNGDFRLLIAPYRGGNAVILMKQRDDTADGKERYRYSSPVTEVIFDTVRWLTAAKPVISVENDHVTAELFVSWELLETEVPVSGTELTGDVGIIGANAEGTVNAVRIYRSNPCTNLVNDQPGESVIQPEGFGRIQFI